MYTYRKLRIEYIMTTTTLEGDSIELWAVVPFYYDKDEKDADVQKRYLVETVEGLRTAGIEHIVIVDDGSEMKIDNLAINAELLTLDKNYGKAQAIREGLKYVEEHREKKGYVVQCDYDADQRSEDAALLVRELHNSEGGGMIIGDRYAEAQPDPPEYRKEMLKLQKMISAKLGYEVSDAVSGLRVYSSDLAHSFLVDGKSDGFGSDAEQFVIAYLEHADIRSVPLTYSRERSSSTNGGKLAQVMEAILLHRERLIDRGLEEFVDFFEELQQRLVSREDDFRIDLSKLDQEGDISFHQTETGEYTAKISPKRVENAELNPKRRLR